MEWPTLEAIADDVHVVKTDRGHRAYRLTGGPSRWLIAKLSVLAGDGDGPFTEVRGD